MHCLKIIADQNRIEGVSLFLGMYKMTESNTPGIRRELSAQGIECIPEAHFYLKLNGRRIDLTSPNANIEKIENDILTEQEITPRQVINFKVDFHKDFLRKWIEGTNLEISFGKLWTIREKCIANL